MGETQDPQPPTLTVKQYCELSGEGEHAVRADLLAGKIPHIRSGRRGLVKILRGPALARLGAATTETRQ